MAFFILRCSEYATIYGFHPSFLGTDQEIEQAYAYLFEAVDDPAALFEPGVLLIAPEEIAYQRVSRDYLWEVEQGPVGTLTFCQYLALARQFRTHWIPALQEMPEDVPLTYDTVAETGLPAQVIVQPRIIFHLASGKPQDDYLHGHTIKADARQTRNLFASPEETQIASWLAKHHYRKVDELALRPFAREIDGIYRSRK